MQEKKRIAIFASGSGTNAERIVNHFRGHPDIEVAVILTNNPRAFVLERARRLGIRTRIFDRAQFSSGQVLQWLQDERISHVVLAGFLWLIPPGYIKAFPDRMINIHPALLPRFGGKGMYGHKVHEAVLQSGDTVSGITIHLVNELYDEGRVLFQAKCPVHPGDSAQDLAEKIHQLEYEHYPAIIEQWISSGG